jgi:tRNA(Arg) A34 adenosine deaminase TadA
MFVLTMVRSIMLFSRCMVVQIVVGKKVATGRSSTRKQHNTPSTHAEIDAFKKLSRHYLTKGVDLYVFRFTQSGELKESRPCFHCLKTLSRFNINYVYYSTREGTICKEKLSEMMSSEDTTVSSAMRMKMRKRAITPEKRKSKMGKRFSDSDSE